MNTELNNYLKSIDYIPINYTSKIKDINDYIQMIFKAIEEKYNKCIFYILLNELPSNIIFVIKQCINCNYPNNDIIAFYNKDNYIFNSLSNSLSNSRINIFLEIQLNPLYISLDIIFGYPKIITTYFLFINKYPFIVIKI